MTLDAVAPTVVFVATAVVAVLIARALQQGPINPISVYATVWSTLAVLVVVPLADLQPMRLATWGLMFASSVALVLGATHAWLFLASVPRRTFVRPSTTPVAYSEPALRAAYLVGLVALLGYVGIEAARPPIVSAVQSVGGLGGILHGSGLEYRNAYVELALKRAQSGFEDGGLAVAVLGYILFLPAMLAMLLAGHFALKRRWWMVAAPLALMAIYSMVSLERTLFIHALLLWLFSYYYHATVHRLDGVRTTRLSTGRRLGIAAVVLAVAAAAIYFPLKIRYPSLTPLGTVQSALAYFSGPLGALNVYVMEHPLVTPSQPQLGTYSLWGAASVLLRLGVPLHLPPDRLEFVPFQVHGDRVGNVYTWLIYFILDFGWVGAVVIPYLFGLAATALHYLVVVRGRRDLIAPLCILMAQLVMSFFGFSLLRDLRFWFVLLFAPFLVRAVLARQRNPVRADA